MNDQSTPAEELSPLKRAFLALEDAQERLARLERERREPIAIVGLGMRLPGGANDAESFWRLLADGVDAIREIPADRWDADAWYDPDPNAPGKMNTRWGAFLERVDLFDPQFFGIAPREAAGMDPQQRLLLEAAWEALENAGLSPKRLAGSRTGVFFGACKNDYMQMQVKLNDPARYDGYFTSGNAGSILSGRLSYILGLRGPSITVDTACSSSLVAVHLACQSLRAGECDAALAGGVNLILSPDHTIAFCKSGMMSPEGRCKTFDAAADGFVQGEGCGAIVLQRLSDALAEGRRPLALIRASAANQDGASSGLTAPSGPAQEAVIREALERAGVAPAEIDYVEAHGTGTSLGDPIEVRALAATLGEGRPPERPLWIGSVKTNLGHLEGAAGVAGLIKAALCLGRRAIPPHLHFRTPSPHIPWDACPLRVPTELTPWPPRENGPRRAGVSAFGFSGTNVHVVLEEYEEDERKEEDRLKAGACQAAERPLQLLAISAASEGARAELARRYERRLAERNGGRLDDICHTAACGRKHFAHRLAIVGEHKEELREALAAVARGEAAPGAASGEADPARRPKIAFLFTGQGSQYANMGRGLFEREPVFRAVLERCDKFLRENYGLALLEALYPRPGEEAGAEARLAQTGLTQPALFALEVALAELWRAWGIEPGAVLGHSVGEYAAACVAGVFGLEDGLRLIAERGRLMQALPAGGRMAALQCDEATALEAIAPYAATVSLAAVNGPRAVVISGAGGDVEKIMSGLEACGIKGRPLNVSHAFHSPLMAPMEEAFGRVAEAIQYEPARIRLISNVTGRAAAAGEAARGEYWRRHVRQPVRFAEGMAALADQRFQVFIEIGPNPVLCGMGAECLAGGQEAHWLASLRRGRDDWRTLLGSLARLYTLGGEIDWEAFDRDGAARFTALPTYPFERERYWFNAERGEGDRETRRPGDGGTWGLGDRGTGHPLLGERLALAIGETVHASRVSAEQLAFLEAHRVLGRTVMPGTAYLEMALAAARERKAGELHNFVIAELHIGAAMIFAGDGARDVQFILEPEREGRAAFRILSRPADEGGAPWTPHARGEMECAEEKLKIADCGLRIADKAGPEDGGAGRLGEKDATRHAEEIKEIRARCGREMSDEEFYGALAERGLPFGAALRGVGRIWRGEGEALGEIRATQAVEREEGLYRVHPARLDACLQVLAAALPDFGNDDAAGNLYLPVELRGARFAGGLDAEGNGDGWRGTETLLSHARIKGAGAEREGELTADVRVYAAGGGLVAEVEEIILKRVDARALASGERPEEWLYEVAWEEAPGAGADNEHANRTQTTAAMARRLEGRIEEIGGACGVELYERLNPRLDALCAAYAAKALAALGWAPMPGERVEPEALAQRLGLAAQHRRLLALLLEMLTGEGGFLERTGEAWAVVRAPAAPDPERLREELEREGLAGGPEAILTRRCGERLAEALRGAADPLELLFPGGDISCATRLYRETPLARTLNGLVAGAMREIAAAAPADRPLRVLEIGAGTGGTTAHVLPELADGRAEYTFTDAGPFFLAQAARAFEKYPFVQYRPLDIERDPEAQGFGRGAYDVVVAANVLHATADLRRTLGHVRRLLAPGGSLLLLECTRPQRWIDLTFGLTEGWWKFTDAEARPGHPLIDSAAWRALLAETGFEESTAVPEADTGDAISAQAVILARADRGDGPEEKWLIFADRGGVGERVGQLLRERGAAVALAAPGESWEKTDGSRYRLDPAREEDYARLLADLKANGGAPHGVIYGWALDGAALDELTPGRFEEAQTLACRGALGLIKALTGGGGAAPRLWLLTRGAEAVADGDDAGGAAQAPMRGLGRTVALEHPELHCVRIDLDPAAHGPEEARQLSRELAAPDGEDEIAYRSGTRRAARLRRMRNAEREETWGQGDLGTGGQRNGETEGLGDLGTGGREDGKEDFSHASHNSHTSHSLQGPVALVNTTPGVLDGLRYRPMAEPVAGPGEVVIEVGATGLNFRDVLSALDLYGDEPVPLGGECAGTVRAVGEGVRGLKPGEPVVAIAPSSFASRVVASAALTFPRPAALGEAQAAGQLIPYLTAAHALGTLGRMARGERVLIHAAAGGVGLAAVELARQAGAEIFATAGSPEKREYLRSRGIEHVMDSRSLEFARETMDRSGGRGVDLVLNSLAGEFIPAGLGVLAPGGRFLEIGRRGAWTGEQAAALRPDVEYHLINLTGDLLERPEALRPLLEALLGRIAAGELAPLPVKTYPMEQTLDAFRTMSQAKHIGKLAVEMRSEEKGEGTGRRGDEGTWLITGGLGGLGLLTARWLAGRGARHLALLGRGEPDEAARDTIGKLERAGAAVTVYRADAAREDELAGVIRAIQSGPAPLGGVIHAAGVLEDGVLAQQSWPRFAAVLAPKVAGAWNLHRLTADLPLEAFILYSSVAAVFGSPGQGNHAAANAFMDALAHARRSRGLPALSVDWGAWAGAGAAVRGQTARRLALKGIRMMAPEDGFALLERLLAGGAARAVALPVDWPRFMEQFRESAPRLLAGVKEFGNKKTDGRAPGGETAATETRDGRGSEGEGRTRSQDAPKAEELAGQLAALPAGRRRAWLKGRITGEAARVLGLGAGHAIAPTRPLRELGLDSLMAVELRNLLGRAAGRQLPATLLFDYPAVEDLTDYLMRELTGETAPEDAGPKPEPEREAEYAGRMGGKRAGGGLEDTLASLEEMSDEEIERKLKGYTN